MKPTPPATPAPGYVVPLRFGRAPHICSVLLLALLVGCATQPQVEYRVASWPEPPVVNRPELPVLSITTEMDAGTILQLHRETIKRLQAWGLELEAALDAYRKKDTK